MSIHIKFQKGFKRHKYRILQKKEHKNKIIILKVEASSSCTEISSLHTEIAVFLSSRIEISSLHAELAAEVSRRHIIVDNSHQLRQENH